MACEAEVTRHAGVGISLWLNAAVDPGGRCPDHRGRGRVYKQASLKLAEIISEGIKIDAKTEAKGYQIGAKMASGTPNGSRVARG